MFNIDPSSRMIYFNGLMGQTPVMLLLLEQSCVSHRSQMTHIQLVPHWSEHLNQQYWLDCALSRLLEHSWPCHPEFRVKALLGCSLGTSNCSTSINCSMFWSGTGTTSSVCTCHHFLAPVGSSTHSSSSWGPPYRNRNSELLEFFSLQGWSADCEIGFN